MRFSLLQLCDCPCQSPIRRGDHRLTYNAISKAALSVQLLLLHLGRLRLQLLEGHSMVVEKMLPSSVYTRTSDLLRLSFQVLLVDGRIGLRLLSLRVTIVSEKLGEGGWPVLLR